MDETRHFSSFMAQWNYYFSAIALDCFYNLYTDLRNISQSKEEQWLVDPDSICKTFYFFFNNSAAVCFFDKVSIKKPKNCLVFYLSGHSIKISTRISVRILQPSKLVASLINFLETITKLLMIYKNQ